MNLRSLATKIAWANYGLPYRWGGDDPLAGFDCSGLCIEILKSVGILPRNFDTTANGLYQRFTKAISPSEGCLVFWRGSGQSMIHVEYCIDSVHSIGASGGGSSTISTQAAIDQNAYIKVRPIMNRGSIPVFADPFGA